MSTSCLSNSFHVRPPLKMAQAFTKENPGIVTILGSDSERSNPVPSLRRTLSADMSSQKWISHMKKVASCNEIDESEYEVEKKKKAASQSDTWSSVRSQKADLDSSNQGYPSLYVHPLVKKSSSSLSGKSLEICTESLGSETGSDGFSSETADLLEASELPGWKGGVTVKCDYYKKAPRRSFPPPLRSLSGPDGRSLRMQPRRDHGRLVLDAIAVPCGHNNFRAQRDGGRLVLTLVSPQSLEQREETKEDDEETKTEEKAADFSSGLLNAHRLAVMMSSKAMVLANRKHLSPVAHCLPPRPPTACEYYWRAKPAAKAAAATVNPLGQQPLCFKNSGRKLVVCKSKTGNEQPPLVRTTYSSCKEVKRSLVFWEPHCIATS